LKKSNSDKIQGDNLLENLSLGMGPIEYEPKSKKSRKQSGNTNKRKKSEIVFNSTQFYKDTTGAQIFLHPIGFQALMQESSYLPPIIKVNST
jgi:hypothetical protein